MHPTRKVVCEGDPLFIKHLAMELDLPSHKPRPCQMTFSNIGPAKIREDLERGC
ncbi:MAG: hypothetical protein ACLUAR_17755 [Pilosibacter sp.]